MAATSEVLDQPQQLAMEARIRAETMVSDYRRNNIARLRQAKVAAERCAWLRESIVDAGEKNDERW